MSMTTVDELLTLAPWGTVLDSNENIRSSRSARSVIGAIGDALTRADARQRAELRHRLGYLAMALGDVREKAIEAFTLMREGAILTGDERLQALAECGLAAAHDFIGERREALGHACEARRLAESLGDRRIMAIAINEEAQFYKENGENERAFALYREMESIGEALGDTRLVMGAHIGMGRTTDMGRATVGMAHYEQAIAHAKALGDEATLALCYNNLSDWQIFIGEYQAAIDLREESLRLARKWELRADIGRALIGQAKAYTLMGNSAKAHELLRRGFPTVVSVADLEGDLHSSLNLAYLYVESGDVPRGVELYRQTLERSLAAPDHACAVFAQCALNLLADGGMPTPGLLPVGEHELSDADLAGVVGGLNSPKLYITYPTGDMKFHAGP